MLLVAALVAGDVVARRAAESAIAAQVAERVGGDGEVSAHIGGGLFLPSLLFAGKVKSVAVEQAPVTAGGLTLRSVRVEVRGVELDRRVLVDRSRPPVRSIESGLVTATLDDAGLSAALGVRVSIHPDGAEVTVPGVGTVRGPVALTGGRLVVRLPTGRTLSVAIPSIPVLPCASDLVLGEGEATMTCPLTTVPEVLLHVVAGQASTVPTTVSTTAVAA